MSNKILIERGDTALIEVKGGYKTVSYDDLVSMVGIKKRPPSSRRSKNAGTKFSRLLSLSERAVRTGTWSTGSKISVEKVLGNLIFEYARLTPEEICEITETGVKKIISMVISKQTEAYKKPLSRILDEVLITRG